MTVSVAAFENSQSDVSSALESMRNSSRLEDSLVEEPSSDDTPTNDTVEQPPLNPADPLLLSKSPGLLLNHVSEPLPALDEDGVTPDASSSTEVPQLLEPNDSEKIRQNTFQEAALHSEKVAGSPGSESNLSAESEIPAELPRPSATTADLPRRSVGAVFVYLLFVGIILAFIVFETDVLVPLASKFGVDVQLHHLRHDYYLPIRRRICFWN